MDNDGFSTCEGDCDDTNTLQGFNTNPNADEICGNGRDDNCNGQTDEQACCSGSDNDGDGVTPCNGDCNDSLNNGGLTYTRVPKRYAAMELIMIVLAVMKPASCHRIIPDVAAVVNLQ